MNYSKLLRESELFIIMLIAATPVAAQAPDGALSVRGNLDLAGKKLSTPLVVEADNITIDGGGAVIQGPGRANDLASFAGDGLAAKGRKNIIIKNITIRGFRRGAALSECDNLTLENCNFSDNYTDPAFGWGDFERVGGMILDFVTNSRIINCKARNNWNGIDLRGGHHNSIINTDASHCSNVCLKLETSSDNAVENCNLSWGLRKDPGEVHARDSTCVLIESGSDRNRFRGNDITHGGDGVFIRVLNGWMSQGNVFTENDCSYANNNGFESWSQGNSYYRNKANYCSYGFWLGGSDKTILEGNEAAWNGLASGFHNAPESDFGHGGIVIVHGTGSHTLIDNNYCHDNNGGGIVFRGDLATRGEKWKIHHMILQRNRLENNKWGIFGRFADNIWLSANNYKNNEKPDLMEEISNLHQLENRAENAVRPVAAIGGDSQPLKVKIGEEIQLDGSASSDPAGAKLTYAWTSTGADWNPKVQYSSPVARHTFQEAGFYRIGLTVSNGALSNLAWRDCYVISPEADKFTENGAAFWASTGSKSNININDDMRALCGGTSVHFGAPAFAGGLMEARLIAPPGALPDFSNINKLSFWIRYQNANIGGFGGANPVVRLQSGNATITLTPVAQSSPRNLLMDLVAPETRDGWVPIDVDLRGGPRWSRIETFEGAAPAYYNSGLEMRTLSAPFATGGPTALVSAQKLLFCAVRDGARLMRSDDGGRSWREMKNISSLAGAPANWSNGALAMDPRHGAQGSLYLRFESSANGASRPAIAIYDIAEDEWSLMPTFISMTHGATISGRYLYGISHARMGNYGGAICKIALDGSRKVEERTMLALKDVPDPDWYGVPAQLLAVGKRIYCIKNDWISPRPEPPAPAGDRLLDFDPELYNPSTFAGGDPDDTKKWREARTPARDLGPLPFEIGRGASLAALPPKWCPGVGAAGGLFIIAGCSPSNHEGDGTPSALFTIYDIESHKFTNGELPGPTGAGSSITFHDGAIYIKRGGLGMERADSEFWVVKPLPPELYELARSTAKKLKFDPAHVTSISLQFQSAGGRDVDLWLDGLRFEK